MVRARQRVAGKHGNIIMRPRASSELVAGEAAFRAGLAADDSTVLSSVAAFPHSAPARGDDSVDEWASLSLSPRSKPHDQQ